MADEDYTEEQAPDQPQRDPAVAAFQDAMSNAPPELQSVADEVSTRLNHYATVRDIADENTAAGDKLVNDMATFKGGLVSMVQTDPGAVHTALDIVPPVLRSIVDSAPHEGADETHAAITQDVQSSIAHAAVTAAAERHGDYARGLLDNDRISGLLSDDEKAGLGHYITAQEVARGADYAGQQQELAKQQARTWTAAANGHLSDLLNPATDAPDFKGGWAQRVTADTNLSPTDKGELMHLYGRLQTNGDARTDAHTFTDMARAAADGALPNTDVIRAAGTDLSLADARFLHGAAGTETADGRQGLKSLADTLERARTDIIGRAGENGAAGDRAYQRFTDWFVPQYRRGAASLGPNADNFAFQNTTVRNFMPTGSDIVPSAPAASRTRPLSDIFGGKRV